jgi:hypothetical protein
VGGEVRLTPSLPHSWIAWMMGYALYPSDKTQSSYSFFHCFFGDCESCKLGKDLRVILLCTLKLPLHKLVIEQKQC